MVACHRLQGGFVSLMCAALYACVSMHDQYTLAMQIDAMRACAIQQHGTVADTVEEVASDAADQRPKRRVRLKTTTQRVLSLGGS